MLLSMFKTFFFTGLFTFGGGAAMVSIMEKEVVEKKKWLDIDEFLDLIAIAQASPGAMAINSSIIIGYKLKGLLGAIICALGSTIPSFVIMIALATVLTNFKDNNLVKQAFMGIRPVIAGLMASAVVDLSVKSNFKYKEYILVVLVAVLITYFGLSPILPILVGGFGYLGYRLIKKERDRNDR